MKGTLFLVGEVVALATNLGIYWARQAELSRNGYLSDRAADEGRFVVQHVAFAVLGALLIGGALDAYLEAP